MTFSKQLCKVIIIGWNGHATLYLHAHEYSYQFFGVFQNCHDETVKNSTKLIGKPAIKAIATQYTCSYNNESYKSVSNRPLQEVHYLKLAQ